MLKWALGWRVHSRSSKYAIACEADDLILQLGVNACEEARRRRRDSNDLSAARHWSAVTSEIGRRFLESRRSAGADRTPSFDGDVFCSLWTPVADRRAESHELAEIIKMGCGEPANASGASASSIGSVDSADPARRTRGKRDIVAELQAAIRLLPSDADIDAGELTN